MSFSLKPQTSSPQTPIAVQQSTAHEPHDSPPDHVPSPQNAHGPQSLGQLVHGSPGEQTKSPHPLGQPKQSAGHVMQLSPSPSWHTPSPQHDPQSAGHVAQLSPNPSSHAPLPHDFGQ